MLEFDVKGKAVILFEAEGGLRLFNRGEYLDSWGALVETVAETVVVIVVIDITFLNFWLGFLHIFVFFFLLLFLANLLGFFLHLQILELPVQRGSHNLSVEARIKAI